MRAACVSLRRCETISSLAIAMNFAWERGDWFRFQSSAIASCSAVRVSAICRTSASAAVNWVEPKAGGGPGAELVGRGEENRTGAQVAAGDRSAVPDPESRAQRRGAGIGQADSVGGRIGEHARARRAADRLSGGEVFVLVARPGTGPGLRVERLLDPHRRPGEEGGEHRRRRAPDRAAHRRVRHPRGLGGLGRPKLGQPEVQVEPARVYRRGPGQLYCEGIPGDGGAALPELDGRDLDPCVGPTGPVGGGPGVAAGGQRRHGGECE